MQEDYTDFGTSREGKLWADIHGTMDVVNGLNYMTFTKTYRYFDQTSVIYRGAYDSAKKSVQGTWSFPAEAGAGNGTFIMSLK